MYYSDLSNISYNLILMSQPRKIKIAHSLQELEDQIILTIKDRPILQNGQIDQDVDILQNDELQNINEAQHNSQLRGKLKNIMDASSSHLQAKNQGLTDILPHYNDYSYKPQEVEVEEGSILKPKKVIKKNRLNSDYQQELSVSKLNAQYSKKQFNKKGINKKDTLDLLSFLEETAADNVDLEMKRQFDASNIIDESLNKIRKQRIFYNQLKNETHLVNVSVTDEQDLLLKSIERSRKKVERQQDKFNILQTIQEENDHQDNEVKVQISLNPIANKCSDNIRKQTTIDLKDAIRGTASVMFMSLPSEKLSKVSKEEDKHLPESFRQISKEELQKMRAEVKFLQDKEVGIGLSQTLKYLRENSLLGKEEQVGRYNDKSADYNDPNDRIKLEYRNASGKLMKPKEAFRYICATFHGQGPGKNKVQKRKKRQLLDMQIKSSQNTDGKLLNMLQKHQEKTGEAHMIINLGGKGGS